MIPLDTSKWFSGENQPMTASEALRRRREALQSPFLTVTEELDFYKERAKQLSAYSRWVKQFNNAIPKGQGPRMQDDIFAEIDSIKLDPLNKRYEINKRILSAICGQTGLTLANAKAVLIAIVKTQIPNVTVNYGNEDKT